MKISSVLIALFVALATIGMYVNYAETLLLLFVLGITYLIIRYLV